MKKQIGIILGALMGISGGVYAACPATISHKEAALIAKGDDSTPNHKKRKPIDMVNVINNSTMSKVYSNPKLSKQTENEEDDDRWTCLYEYQGKVSKGYIGRTWEFSFSTPKDQFEYVLK